MATDDDDDDAARSSVFWFVRSIATRLHTARFPLRLARNCRYSYASLRKLMHVPTRDWLQACKQSNLCCRYASAADAATSDNALQVVKLTGNAPPSNQPNPESEAAAMTMQLRRPH